MNLENAAKALVASGYATKYDLDYGVRTAKAGWVSINPLNNEAQRQALLEWFEVQVHKISVNDWYAQSGFCKAANFTAHGRHGVSRIKAENNCIEACLDE